MNWKIQFKMLTAFIKRKEKEEKGKKKNIHLQKIIAKQIMLKSVNLRINS